MDNKFVIAGFAGLVGLMLGIILAPSGPGTEEIERALSGRFEAIGGRVDEAGQSVAALDERLVVLEAAAAERTQAMAAMSEDLAQRIDTAVLALDDRMVEINAASNAALETAIRDLQDRIADAGAEGGESVAGADAGDGQAASAAAAGASGQAGSASGSGAPQAQIAAGMLYATGQTARAGDGALRAFVSRIDDASGSVVLSVNGTPTTLAAGQAVTEEVDGRACRVSLVGIRDRRAGLDAVCEEASAGSQGGSGDSGGDAVPDGIAPGSVALLGEGAVRVFVSSVASDGSSARIAINGVTTQQVAGDDRIELQVDGQTCAVTIGGIGGNRVGLDYSCGS